MGWSQALLLLRDLAYAVLCFAICWRVLTFFLSISFFSVKLGAGADAAGPTSSPVANMKLFKLTDDDLEHLRRRVAKELARRANGNATGNDSGNDSVPCEDDCCQTQRGGQSHANKAQTQMTKRVSRHG